MSKEIIIKTNVGEVKGTLFSDVAIFKGIPYAKTNRFENPTSYIWDGVYDATDNEIDSYQFSSFYDNSMKKSTFYDDEFRFDGKEYHYADSPMTLNIVKPNDANNLPVLIFIHGGGFENGKVGEVPYGDTKEYAKRGIIFVSIGYRLNVFAMYRGENYGLKDQVAAIKWVYDNIEAFGGDKEKITICGQSAGAMSLQNLLYSDKLKGIVKGAIMMSGGGVIPSMMGPKPKEGSYEFWDKVRSDAGVATDEELKNVDPKVLWDAWNKNIRSKGGYMYMQPAIDGEIVIDDPKKLVKENKHLDIPLMIGITSQDFVPILLYELAYNFAKRNHKYKRNDVYCYFFDRYPPGNKFKAFHAVDLWYLFGNMQKSWRPFDETDYKLCSLMCDYVANFVKTQNPNGDNLPSWPATSKKQKGMKLFDGVNDEKLIYPCKARRKVWKTLLFDKGPM